MGAEAHPRRRQQAGRAGGLTGPPPLALRHVVAGDAARLRALRLGALAADPDAFGSTLARDRARDDAWWAAWCAASAAGDQQRTFVLVDPATEAWVGLALVRALDARRAELLSMWVAPAVRGHGAARRLCDACADWAARRGLAVLALAVFAPNTRARAAYAAAGFAIAERVPIVTDDGRRLEELRMERRLG